MSPKRSPQALLPLAPLPPSLNSPCNEFSKYRRTGNFIKMYQEAEQRRGHSVVVKYDSEKDGAILVCAATHRPCPWVVCASPITLPDDPSQRLGYRVQRSPHHCIEHNHAPLFTVPPPGSDDLPVPIPIQPFVDFLYSFLPRLVAFIPRLEQQGINVDFSPDLFLDLVPSDIEQVLETVGMSSVERKSFIAAIEKVRESKEKGRMSFDGYLPITQMSEWTLKIPGYDPW